MLIKKVLLVIIIFLMFTSISVMVSCSGATQSALKSVFISFNANGGFFESGQPTCSVNIKQGESISLPESPSRDGYVFIDWYLSTEFREVDKLNIALFKAMESKTIFAKWESVDTYQHYIQINNYSEAIITSDCARASMGTIVTLSITILDNAYMLKPGSLRANDSIIDENSLRFEMLSSSVIISAIFELRPFEINIINEEYLKGRVYLGCNTASKGDLVNIYAIPDIGYRLDEISILNNSSIIYNNVFTMEAFDVQLVVNFSPIDFYEKYAIEFIHGGNVDFECSHEGYASAGEYVSLNIFPKKGYCLEKIFLNNIEISPKGFIMPFESAIISFDIGLIDENAKYKVTLSQQPSSLQDEYVKIKNPQNLYSSGEIIELDTELLGDYVIDGIAINGEFMSLENIIMPSEDAILTVELVFKGYSLILNEANKVNIELSHTVAKQGEIVRIKILEELNGRKLIFKYWEHPDGDREIVFDNTNLFIMPDYDICFGVDVYEVFSEKREVNIVSSENGSVEKNKDTAGYNEIVLLTIIPVDGFAISRLYYNDINNNEIDIIEIDSVQNDTFELFFIMPNQQVVICAEFKKYFTISLFQNEKISIYPDREKGFKDDSVYVSVQSRNNYNIAGITPTVNGIDLDESKYFYIGENDIVLHFREAVPQTGVYSIKYPYPSSLIGGSISGASSSKSGSFVLLRLKTEKGYRLKSLKLRKSSEADVTAIEIPETFLMPEYNVTVLAEFEPYSPDSFSLAVAYESKKQVYLEDFGIFLKYIDNLSGINEYFQSCTEFSLFSHYIEGMLVAETSWDTFYYILEVNQPILLNSIGQIINREMLKMNFNYDIDTQIYDNYIVVSLGGSAQEDYLSFKNGLRLCEGRFLIYENIDGTYSTYRYIYDEPYVLIPKEYKLNDRNKRIVSSIGMNTFKNNNNLKGIALTYVRSLSRFSLYSMKQIIEIDLSQISLIGKGALADLQKLERYYVSNDNADFSVDSKGVLFSKNKDSIISYANGKLESEYNIPTSCKIISNYAFYNAIYLQKINFSAEKKIESIGEYSFYGCVSLASIDLANTSILGFANMEHVCASGVIIGSHAFANLIGINEYKMGITAKIGFECFEWDSETSLLIDFSINDKIVKVAYSPIIIPEDSLPNLRIKVKVNVIEAYNGDLIWGNYSCYILGV